MPFSDEAKMILANKNWLRTAERADRDELIAAAKEELLAHHDVDARYPK